MISADALSGWMPIRVYQRHGQAWLDWCYLGERRFTEPFFEQTIGSCLQQPFQLLFRHQTPIEILEALPKALPAAMPRGFIFHMSRCGSTLISQMLATLPENIVISEAGPIDAILRMPPIANPPDEGQRIGWLRGMVSALGQARSGRERHLYMKFDSWSVFELPLLRRAFPEVPWIFLYRDPIEVLVSHARSRGPQVLPGVLAPELVGLTLPQVIAMTPDQYSAHVLTLLCRVAAGELKSGGLAIHYRQLPDVLFTTLLEFFGVSYTAEQLEQMRAAVRYDAKSPARIFTNDRAAKQQEASEEIRNLADRVIGPVYDQLERINSIQFGSNSVQL